MKLIKQNVINGTLITDNVAASIKNNMFLKRCLIPVSQLTPESIASGIPLKSRAKKVQRK